MFNFNHSQTFEMLATALDGLERRQKLIANNVSNMNTPGYRAREVDFQYVMQQKAAGEPMAEGDLELRSTSGGHQGSALDHTSDAWDYATVVAAGPPDLQDQMVRLNQTTLHYAAVTQSLNQQLSRYRQVITEGRR